jgi:hypothetical protein
MSFHIEFEREDDVRRIADVPNIIGVFGYVATAKEEMKNAKALAARTLAACVEFTA